MDDEQETELRNPFPSPPEYYTRYTPPNVRLLAALKGRRADDPDSEQRLQELLGGESVEGAGARLAGLEKPRVDWIMEEGQYTTYGDTWFIKEVIPSLHDLGGHQLYPTDPTIDRRPALLSILRTLLATYSALLKSLLNPPNFVAQQDGVEWQKYVEWITIMGQNMMSAANELRPVQARCNLEAMMTRQLQLRRDETTAIHKKCDELEAKLAMLKANAKNTPSTTLIALVKPKETALEPLSLDDVLKWAEGS